MQIQVSYYQYLREQFDYRDSVVADHATCRSTLVVCSCYLWRRWLPEGRFVPEKQENGRLS